MLSMQTVSSAKRRETDVLWLWSTVLQTVSFTVLLLFLCLDPTRSLQTVMRWSVAVAPLCCASSSSLVPISLSRSLLLYLSLPLSLTAAVLQCCSLLWLVCRNGVNPFLPREWGCTLPFVFLSFSPSSFSLHPAMAAQSRLHLSVPAEMLGVLFKHCVGVACFHSYLMPCSVMKVDRGPTGKRTQKECGSVPNLVSFLRRQHFMAYRQFLKTVASMIPHLAKF